MPRGDAFWHGNLALPRLVFAQDLPVQGRRPGQSRLSTISITQWLGPVPYVFLLDVFPHGRLLSPGSTE